MDETKTLELVQAIRNLEKAIREADAEVLAAEEQVAALRTKKQRLENALGEADLRLTQHAHMGGRRSEG